MKGIRQHEPLRVPDGWRGKEKGLITQLERIFDDIYKLFGRLKKSDLSEELSDQIDSAVTDVGYNGNTQKLTQTVNGTTSDIVRIATLGNDGKIPANQLPSYVDDVEEYADTAHFPATGESDKIYVALDTGFTYRWSGSQYVRLNTYDPATQSASGLMSAADKTKLDGVETGANNYSLPLAANGTRGGVQVGYTASGKNYPVQLSGEKMFVNVPWTDHYAWSDITGKPSEYTPSDNSDYYTLWDGNLRDAIGSGTPAAATKTYWENNIPNLRVVTAYDNAGDEYTIIFSKGANNQWGNVLKWGYKDNYLRLLRRSSNAWVTTDWEKISAGYADSAGAVAWGNVSGKPTFFVSETKSIAIDANGYGTIGTKSGYTPILVYDANDGGGAIIYKASGQFKMWSHLIRSKTRSTVIIWANI